MKLNKLLSTLLSTILCLTMSAPAFAAVSDTGFSDVDAGTWYAESIMYVRNNSIMSGTDNFTFSPDATMTRTMLATVLYRMAGSPAVSGAPDFTDVASGAYYGDALAWASENNIISGYGNGLFGVDDPVSREQIAVILWRYHGGETTTVSNSFTDSFTISDYAASAVSWAAANGIVSGRSDGSFGPRDSATRAQVAAILHRYLSRGEVQVPDTEPNTEPNTQLDSETSNILIAYFSRAGENYGVGTVEKGNTQYIAEFIAEETNGALCKIETETPYPTGYDDTTAIAQQEQADNARPTLSTHVENMDQYDTIFLGYPIWYGDMPMAMYTFLEEYDFSGKTIIPFSTHAGSGWGSSISTITRLCPDAVLLDGFSVAGAQAAASRAEVKSWLEEMQS